MTGVSRYIGGVLARRLAADPSVDRVIGVDVIPPPRDLGDAEFVRADIRNPMIGKVIAQGDVDTVVHANVIATPTFAGGRTPQKEINVIGTMQLLAACQKAERLRKLVVQSSISVYGASPRDPVKFTEDLSPRAQPRTGFGKDSVEVESYVRGLARRRPDVVVTTQLRNPTNRLKLGGNTTLSGALSYLQIDSQINSVHVTEATATKIWLDTPTTVSAAFTATGGFSSMGDLSVSGNLALRMDESAGLDIDAKSVSGAVQCGIGTPTDHSGPGQRRTRMVTGDGSARLRVQTVSGDVTVVARPAPAEVA